MYQVHFIRIHKQDREKCDEILLKYWYKGDLDDITISRNVDGSFLYGVSPYIYEDFETITNELKLSGIRVM